MSTVDISQHALDETFQTAVHTLIEEIEAEGDKKTANKCRQVWYKLQEQIVHIGFCGLFSAGKSTMINTLLEAPLLPSSPIPTTANVVTIRDGSTGACIELTNGHKLELDIRQLEDWQAYCKDGDQVQKIDLYHSHELLDGVQFLDTPGIDSNDSRHQKATDDALYLADVVIFVADYHHVQSELNYHFLKVLQEQGKTLFFVINQIDKHRDHELPVSAFVQRLQEGFEEWGIDVEGIIPTSLKIAEHPLNFLPTLKSSLQRIREQRAFYAQKHFAHALKQLLDEHRQFLRHTQKEQRNALQTNVERLKQECAYDDHPYLLEEYEQDRLLPQQWEEEVLEGTRKITTDAIITPYTTTRLAENLIESYQKDFKPGWLFTHKKKLREQRQRSQKLYEDVCARIKSQVEWHLKDLLRKKAEQYRLHDPHLQQALVDWELTLPQEWLTEAIKTNVDTRQFVYTYTKELTQKVARLYQKQIEELASRVRTWLSQRHESTYAPLQGKIERFRAIEREQAQLEELDKAIEQRIAPYQQLAEQTAVYGGEAIASPIDLGSGVTQDRGTIHLEKDALYESGQRGDQIRAGEKADLDTSRSPAQPQSSSAFSPRWNQTHFFNMAEKFEQAADLLAPLSSLQNIVRDYQQRANRLKEQRFQICLFGAFSAGKSSFANALLGESILPVSAHPTTASINFIKQPREDYPHDTALVRMKSEEQIEEEINLCLKRLSLALTGDLSERLQRVKQIQPQNIRSSLKPYESFLRSCLKGYESAKEHLGSSILLDRQSYQTYVSVEHRACFVADIQLFYDSPLSRAGVELIDTPGADSIYTRHTNVTFDFIKHADVILYVTYYNHAFSRADREFLDQLGKVKDQFALDKMFFLINAADLAESTEELDDVIQYVESELLASGIRFPRLFPVSSLKAMQGDPTSNIALFEHDLLRFMEDELVGLLKTSAEHDLQRGYDILTDLQKELQENVPARKQKSAQLEIQEKEWVQVIADQDRQADLQELNKEIEELFYYVKQRLSYAWKDYFTEAFSPSVLTAGKANRQQLSDCLEEFTDLLIARLQTEGKATSLRIENVVHRLQDRFLQEWQEVTKQADISLDEHPLQKKSWSLPPISAEWPGDYRQDLRRTLRHFKQPKHFFEQGGKDLMFQDMEPILNSMVDDYVDQEISTFQDYYHSIWYKIESETKQRLKEMIHSTIKAKQSVLRGDISDHQLQNMKEIYKRKLLKNFH